MSLVMGAILLLHNAGAAPTPDPIDAVTNVQIVNCDHPINGQADPLTVIKKALDDMFTLANVAYETLNKTISQANATSLAFVAHFLPCGLY
jgi:hypothetical protein